MGVTVGIDAGSRSIKVVVLDRGSGHVIAHGIDDQGTDQADRVRRLCDRVLGECGTGHGTVRRTVATGYARHIVEGADARVTEITCHARGVHHGAPDAKAIIEIGGQDSKIMWLGPDGTVHDFRMNDRCAAGTGRFLEMVSDRMAVPLHGLGALAARSRHPSTISSMCVVFAESEIIGLLACGAPREDIVAGVQAAIAARVAGMAGRMRDGPVIFTGGVALVGGMAAALSAAIGTPVEVAPEPQMTGALGAALIAAD
ncbi:MAG TPA: acyl-CoA dehydratase activase [Verrucomicrobiae bacterium]|nr:acyl-CoA dehydratase activase [Verrucomicrobiae bacterium]